MCQEKIKIQLNAVLGNDENDGISAPIKTLKRAWELLYTLPTAGDVEVSLAPGKYPVSSALALYGEGMKNKPQSLSFIGNGAEIIGTETIDGKAFEKVEGKPYYRYQFEMVGKSYPNICHFYVNGKMQTVAHQGYLRAYDARKNGTTMFRVPEPFEGIDKVEGVKPPLDFCEENGFKLYLPKEAVAPLPDGEILNKVEFHMSIAWYYRVLHLLKVDKQDEKDGNVAVYFRPEEMRRWSAMHGFKGNFFFLQNDLSFLDEPGEHYYDRETGVLYYYPAEGVDLESAHLEIPSTEQMLAFFNLENVSFEGLSFYGNENRVFENGYYAGGQAATAEGAYGPHSKAVIYIKNAKNYSLKNCVFKEIATTGVKFSGVVQNLSVEDCRFFNIGMTALDIGEHCGVWGANDGYYHAIENVRILRNVIDGAALLTRGSIAFYMSVGKEVEIAYNTIQNTSYTCISVGWRWGEAQWGFGEKWHLYHVDIHHNYFTNFMTGQADGGTIYTLGGNVANDYHEHFNFMHDNFVFYSDACWDGKGMIMPYYHDGASSNWHTHHNAQILYPGRGVHAAIYLQNISSQLAHNILVEDNDIVLPFGDDAPYAAGATCKDHSQFKSNKEFDVDTLEMKIFGPDWRRRDENGNLLSRVEKERDLYQKNTMLYDNPNELPAEVIARSASTGAPGYQPDMAAIIQEMQAVYDAYYASKE